MAGNFTRRAVLGLTAASAAGAVTGVLAPTGSAAGSTTRRGGTARFEALSRHLDGDLILPSDPRYGQAREQSLRQFDTTRPMAVAYCQSTRDVQTVLAFAQDKAIHAVPRSGGHSFGGYSTTTGIILDVSRLNHISTDGTLATIGAGTQQVDALLALTPHGLALASGLCPTVGAGGFIQGGGIGHQTRKYGMACDRLVSAEVVLANRRVVQTSATEHPDLYWALRGNGGGNYGVVTKYTLEPIRRSTLIGYRLVWTQGDAAATIDTWQQWVTRAPDDLSSLLIAGTTSPPSSTVVISVAGTWYGAEEDLNRHIDEFVAAVGVPPVNRIVAERTVQQGMMQIYGCGNLTAAQCHRSGTTPESMLPRWNYYRTRCRMFDRPLPLADVEDLLAVLTDPTHSATGQTRKVYFEALGGAANQLARTDTAYVHRTTQILAGLTAELPQPTPATDDATTTENWLAQGFTVLNRHCLPESYQNYMDPTLDDWKAAYYAENYPRLARTKRTYDPHDIFHFPRSIR
ncbi:FAD-dependent oxidoreductase [Streptomyces stackebrandtii]|uniref:FAD-dependent oxidoreductase n=1 Tax=Streptomyces stackebrandtii TaxID=3051177 RepID=UPI0028DBFC6E|nr:FAD-dependent oxidoreductase [Streptomyces sp. DSM 40976]